MTEQFGPFTIHECLGIGATTRVHRASVQPPVGPRRDFALRRLQQNLLPDRETVDDFVREGKLAVGLSHPNIVRTYAVGWHGNLPYVAMELVAGNTLERLASSPRGVSTELALSLLIELCEAIEYAGEVARRCGVHGKFGQLDASPYNLIVTHDGHLKVIDAAAIRPDAFSVAAIAWGLLAGRRLFDLDEPDHERCDVLDDVVQEALDARAGHRPSLRQLREAFVTIQRARRCDDERITTRRAVVTPPFAAGTPAPERTRRGCEARPALAKLRFARGTTPYPHEIVDDPQDCHIYAGFGKRS